MDEIVFGTVGRVGDTHLLSLTRIEVRTASVKGRTAETVPGAADRLLRRCAGQLDALISGEPPKLRPPRRLRPTRRRGART